MEGGGIEATGIGEASYGKKTIRQEESSEVPRVENMFRGGIQGSDTDKQIIGPGRRRKSIKGGLAYDQTWTGGLRCRKGKGGDADPWERKNLK